MGFFSGGSFLEFVLGLFLGPFFGSFLRESFLGSLLVLILFGTLSLYEIKKFKGTVAADKT